MRFVTLAVLLLEAPAGIAAAQSPAAAGNTMPAPAPGAEVAAPLAPPASVLVEKLGAGDRAYLSGDHRTALFAYQDAVYLDSTSVAARIRLARAYLRLGHPGQAEQQLKLALDLDPASAEARKLLEELASPPQPARAAAPAVLPGAMPRPAPATPPSQLVYRLTEDAGASPAAGALPAIAPVVKEPQEASRRYRSALTMIGARDFNGAIVELDRALELDPQFGAAISARASAFYGLGRYREAARDYQLALMLAPHLATPLYGLAESFRHLDDPRAAEYYARYAESDATDVRPDLRVTARQRLEQLGGR